MTIKQKGCGCSLNQLHKLPTIIKKQRLKPTTVKMKSQLKNSNNNKQDNQFYNVKSKRVRCLRQTKETRRIENCKTRKELKVKIFKHKILKILNGTTQLSHQQHSYCRYKHEIYLRIQFNRGQPFKKSIDLCQ